jgi:hypothetical protein
MVKVTLDLPENVWKALQLVADKFGGQPEHWATFYIENELGADADDYFQGYILQHFGPLSIEIKRLLIKENNSK